MITVQSEDIRGLSVVLIFTFRTLQKHKLHKFEVACLANLAPADADEAKALLPRCTLS